MVRVETPEERSAKIEDLAADCAGRWKEPGASRERGKLLYDDFGLPKATDEN